LLKHVVDCALHCRSRSQVPPTPCWGMRSAPLGMRVMRRRASFISAPVVLTHSCARGSVSIGTPNAFATQSAVMSPWVGPIPPW
jgi:hypothetical protein